MTHLEVLLEAHNVSFDALPCRIHCFPHILNLCVGHVIKSLMNLDLPEDDEWITTLPKWKFLQNSQPCLKPFLDIGLQWAQKYYDHMQSDTCIIAMGM